MARQVIQNGESGLVVRTKLNDNFEELYDDVKDLQDELAAALSDTINFEDKDEQQHEVVIVNGLITSWTIT